jgi:SOS response regulatory protein OraA/RecX
MKKSDIDPHLLQALEKIAYYLGRRDHSELELKNKLKRRFDDQIIQKALKMATEKNWLKKPEELAKSLSYRLQKRNKGTNYIKNYLKKIGLPDSPPLEEDQILSCLDLLTTKFPEWKNFDYLQKQKPARFLLNRGFSMGVVKTVLFSSGDV